MLTTGIVLGLLSLAGFTLTYTRLPKQARDFCLRHPLLTDVGCTWATYEILKGTATALIAAGTVSTGLSLLLFGGTLWANRRAKKATQQATGGEAEA